MSRPGASARGVPPALLDADDRTRDLGVWLHYNVATYRDTGRWARRNAEHLLARLDAGDTPRVLALQCADDNLPDTYRPEVRRRIRNDLAAVLGGLATGGTNR